MCTKNTEGYVVSCLKQILLSSFRVGHKVAMAKGLDKVNFYSIYKQSREEVVSTCPECVCGCLERHASIKSFQSQKLKANI